MKIYAYLACALAVMGLLAYGAHIVKKANRTDAAEAALAGEVKRHRADLAQVEKALAASTLERKKLQQGLTDVTTRFNSIVIPPAKTLVQVKETPGACPRIGVSAQFVSVYNAASSP